MKYAACYCRVSTDEQVKFGFSIQAQKDALEKYCKENNYKYDFFIDEGISASSMKKRKALNEMLEKSNVFDIILFTKLDRLSRNVLDANNINKMLTDNNCTMKAIDEDDIDTSTADGTFIFNLKVSLAQREIGKTSERIKFVFQNKREKGEVTSGTKKYGYDIVNKKYQINPIEAENIVNLYNYFISVNGNVKETYKYFIEHFEGKGYDALYSYLRETAYIGKYKLYRKNVYIDDYIPAILDLVIWQKVQDLITKKSISRKTYNDLFSGLLYCSKCKRRLAKRVDRRSKKIHVNYFCDNSYRYKVGLDERKCLNKKSITEKCVEEFLLTKLSLEFEKFIIKTSSVPIKKIEDNTSKIKSIEKKMNKLKDLYIDDLIDKEEYTKDYKKYKAELDKLKTPVEQEELKDYSYVKEILNSDYKNIYNNLNPINKKKFWLNIIDKIYIEEGKIKEVTFM